MSDGKIVIDTTLNTNEFESGIKKVIWNSLYWIKSNYPASIAAAGAAIAGLGIAAIKGWFWFWRGNV